MRLVLCALTVARGNTEQGLVQWFSGMIEIQVKILKQFGARKEPNSHEENLDAQMEKFHG